jgi:hypothetical protein
VILKLTSRPDGATLAAIMAATGWQAHSVRGFMSTAKKRGVKVDSARNEKSKRVYRVTK